MPWKECQIVEERLRFIARLLDGEKMAGEGISRGDALNTLHTTIPGHHPGTKRVETMMNTEDEVRSSDTKSVARYLDYKKAAEYMSLSYWSVRELVLRGEVPHLKYGTKTLIDRQDLDSWADQNKEIGV